MSAAQQNMTLRFFGAGGAFSRRYGTTCSMITLRSGLMWLIDCGRQAPDQLEAAGLSWHQIEGQIITHVHGDHVYGLEDFAFRRYYESDNGVAAVREGGPRPKLLSHDAVRDEIWETMAAALRYVDVPGGPSAGTLSDYFELIESHAHEAAADNPWHHSESFRCDELEITARETVHVPEKPSTCLEISVGSGQIAWWSGDTTVNPELLARLEPRTTVFFHDCTFIEYPGQVHGSFQELEALPEHIRKKIVLMHHEDDIENNRARAEAIGFRVGLPGHVYDLSTGQQVS